MDNERIFTLMGEIEYRLREIKRLMRVGGVDLVAGQMYRNRANDSIYRFVGSEPDPGIADWALVFSTESNRTLKFIVGSYEADIFLSRLELLTEPK